MLGKHIIRYTASRIGIVDSIAERKTGNDLRCYVTLKLRDIFVFRTFSYCFFVVLSCGTVALITTNLTLRSITKCMKWYDKNPYEFHVVSSDWWARSETAYPKLVFKK